MDVGFVHNHHGILLLIGQQVLDVLARGDGAGRIIGIADVVDAAIGSALTMASTSWLKSSCNGTRMVLEPMNSGAPPPYPGLAMTQLRVGEVKAQLTRCSGSLEPA